MPARPIDSKERYDEAIRAYKKRTPMRREERDELTEAERQTAFTVAKVTRIRVIQQTLDAIRAAIRDGTDLKTFRRRAAPALIRSWGGEIPGRIETIFRTNVQSAYNRGRHAVNTAPAVREARPYWRFVDVDDDRECPICSACGGTILPADDPWWSTHTPLMHHQCRCIVESLTEEEAEDEGVTTRRPKVEAHEGFGAEPEDEGEDWDWSGFDPRLRKVLEDDDD